MNAQIKPELSAGVILLDLPAPEYHKRVLGVATNSTLKILRERSPAHYRAWVDEQDGSETPALAFGKAYHMRVLEPERYQSEYMVRPVFGDLRTKLAREARDRFNEENLGVTFVDQADADKIEAMYVALMQHPVAAGIMRDGHSEVTMQWVDPETGVQCQARADWWKPGKFFMDLKTTEDASPDGFRRSVAKYGYHVQHAHYCDGAAACGQPVQNYLILAQEKEAPYVAAVYHIDANAEARGYELRQRGLATMRKCLDTNTWPGYGTGITELQLPGWALQD